MAKKRKIYRSLIKKKVNNRIYYGAILFTLLICILVAFAYSIPAVGIPIESNIQNYFTQIYDNWESSQTPLPTIRPTPTPSEVRTKPVNKLITSPSDLAQNQYKFTVIVAPDNGGPNIDSRGYPVIHPNKQSTIIGNYSIAYFTNASDGATAVVPVGAYINILISPLYYDSSVLPQSGALVSRIGLGPNPTPSTHVGIWYFAQRQGKAVITLTHKGPIQTDITGKFTIHVTTNKLPNEPAGIRLTGVDNGKTFDVSVGSYIEIQCLGNKTMIDPSHGIIESPGGTYHLPNNVCGLWKAVGAGTAIITTENVH